MKYLSAESSPTIVPAHVAPRTPLQPEAHVNARLQRAQRMFLKRLDEWLPCGPLHPDEAQLKHVLKQFAEHSHHGELDLSLTGFAFTGISKEAKEAWKALGVLCRRREPPLCHLILPQGLKELPDFVRYLSPLPQLTMPAFCGPEIDVGRLGLKALDLGEIGESGDVIRIANPSGCTVQAILANGTRQVWETSAEMPELVIVEHVQASFLKCLDEAIPDSQANWKEAGLKRALIQFAKYGGMKLDLSLTGLAFTRIPEKAWVALGLLCRRPPPLWELTLPSDLKGLPNFVRQLSPQHQLKMPGFSGREIDLSGLELKIL
jgi:hypothetical protein